MGRKRRGEKRKWVRCNIGSRGIKYFSSGMTTVE